MRASTNHHGLALSHFLLAVTAYLAIYTFPTAGLWPVLLPAVPFGLRLFVDRPLFHHGLIDGLLVIFLVTALIGYWAAYDQTAARLKLGLLLAGILLYYAISTQPEANLGTLAGFWFVFGVAVSLYFLFTVDFGVSPAKFHFVNQIGLKWMSIRPSVHWPAIQPTDTAAGIAIITSVYGLYFLAPDAKASRHRFVRGLVLFGFGFVAAAVLLSTSRGALVALVLTFSVFLVWLAVRRMGPWKESVSRFFPAGVLMLAGVTASLLILPLGIWGSGFFIGENLIMSRSELIREGIAIMRDFPFLGGGLGSFPGLFSQYILVIPFFSLLNSHNIFVDVSIEQGMIGGLAFLLLNSIGLSKIAAILGRDHSRQMEIFYGSVFASLFIAMVHGLVDDYLYSGWSAALIFFPLGMGMLAVATEFRYERGSKRHPLCDQFPEKQTFWRGRVYFRGALALVALIIAVVALNWNRIAAQWIANMGAVKMDKIELAGYPTDKWDEGGRIQELQSAKLLFERSLHYNDGNWIANYRLGLIEMSERDFYSASNHLAKAYHQRSWHRGVIKNLGYSYVWLGRINEARLFLEKIPESKSELEVYVWWWETQERGDLAKLASTMVSQFETSATSQ